MFSLFLDNVQLQHWYHLHFVKWKTIVGILFGMQKKVFIDLKLQHKCPIPQTRQFPLKKKKLNFGSHGKHSSYAIMLIL